MLMFAKDSRSRIAEPTINNTQSVIIRLRTTSDPNQIDVEVDFTPECEQWARRSLERLFGYVLGAHTEKHVRPYVEGIIKERRTGMVEVVNKSSMRKGKT